MVFHSFQNLIIYLLFFPYRPWWTFGTTTDYGYVYAMTRKQGFREPVLLDAAEASDDETRPLYADSFRVRPKRGTRKVQNEFEMTSNEIIWNKREIIFAGIVGFIYGSFHITEHHLGMSLPFVSNAL